MDKIKKTVRYNSLLHIYGGLLSKTQYAFADAYFSYDLSLSEIADNREVSRAAVEDAIKKGLKKLETLESELHLLEKRENVLKLTKSLKETTTDNKVIKLVDEIERIIE